MRSQVLSTTALLLSLPGLSQQACSNPGTPANGIQPKTASGWAWSLVSSGLTSPRTIRFDSAGRLLVVQSGVGIVALDLKSSGDCVTEAARHTVVSDSSLNHGLTLSLDGKTLYASNPTTAYSYSYNSGAYTATNRQTIVANMGSADHVTRTLEMSKFAPNTIIVSRGSTENYDYGAASLSTGRSQIRAFPLTKVPRGGYDFTTTGTRLAWGVRNGVGVTEHPVTGGVYSVENSADQLTRNGQDIHEDNPGEKLNFHGTLVRNTYAKQGSSFGYPNCFAAYEVDGIPDPGKIQVGTLFSNESATDGMCASYTPPSLTFTAHAAPLDIKFIAGGSQAWISFHGSWDRVIPAGYKVSFANFDASKGAPTSAPNDANSLTDIFTNSNVFSCPGNCFRPVSLAWDKAGRLYVSSDASGEVYMLQRITK